MPMWRAVNAFLEDSHIQILIEINFKKCYIWERKLFFCYLAFFNGDIYFVVLFSNLQNGPKNKTDKFVDCDPAWKYKSWYDIIAVSATSPVLKHF